jgi:hypothetical protein
VARQASPSPRQVVIGPFYIYIEDRYPMKDDIITVRPTVTTATVQRLPNYVGISELTAGSTGLSMNLVVIPAGAKADPHVHLGYETAIDLLKGRVETRYGDKLAKTVVNRIYFETRSFSSSGSRWFFTQSRSATA